MSVKFLFEIPSECWENCKTTPGYFFGHTLYISFLTIVVFSALCLLFFG